MEQKLALAARIDDFMKLLCKQETVSKTITDRL
jgi:hypothetical protein